MWFDNMLSSLKKFQSITKAINNDKDKKNADLSFSSVALILNQSTHDVKKNQKLHMNKQSNQTFQK